jgi:conjugal transfer pilus assembly protein TraV
MKILSLFRALFLSVTAAGVVSLSGCAVSGLANSTDKFGCKAPDGVACTSVSGIYANAAQDNLPSLRSYRKEVVPTTKALAGTQLPLPVALPGVPLRSQSRTLRIWIAPWVDDENILHDQSFMYVVVDPGQWLLEHSREATVRKTMTRLRAMGSANLAKAEPEPTLTPMETPSRQSTEAFVQQAANVSGDKEDAK